MVHTIKAKRGTCYGGTKASGEERKLTDTSTGRNEALDMVWNVHNCLQNKYHT